MGSIVADERIGTTVSKGNELEATYVYRAASRKGWDRDSSLVLD